jgi:heme-degrading monooxygenase HmoA
MIAVIFEVVPREGQRNAYLRRAASLREHLNRIDGFRSIERFESLTEPGKLLSLSFWRDEKAVEEWRNLEQHRQARQEGRQHLFANYRLRVASVIRDYGMEDRADAPEDSKTIHG